MNDYKKSKEQLIRELSELRQENSDLKSRAAEDNVKSKAVKDLKEAEEALRESEERYRTISSLTTDYIFRLKVDEAGNVKTDMITDNFFTTTSRSIEDIITPDRWASIIHPDDLGKLFDSLHRLLNDGGSTEIECRSFKADGSIRSVMVVSHAIKNTPGGRTTAIVGAVKDISERKKAELALDSEQKLLRTLIDLLPSLVYVKDRDSRFLVANITCANYMGASSPQDLIGKTDADFYPPDAAAGYRSDELEVLNGNPIMNKVEYSVSPLNTQNIILTTKVPFRDSEGNITGLVGASIDISEMKRTEKALITSESNLQALINNKNEAIWSLDNNYHLIVCNDYFRDSYLAAYNEELKVGINLINLLSPELKAFWKPKYDCALAGEKIFFEFRETLNDKVFYFNVYLNPIFSEGSITGVSALSIDVTDRKKEEEALIKAKEKAEESDRLKSAFLANMGHEIRTPMNGIIGFSELLKNSTLTGEEQQKYVKIIETSGVRMLNIINDLIDISKIESGIMEVEISRFNINDQLEYLYSFFEPEARQKGLKLTYETFFHAADAIIESDKQKLNAILINLIKNAIKFTFRGSIRFGYTLKHSMAINDSPEIEFFVMDTGVGIPPEQREIIFERFRQGSESLNRDYEGAGLGLAISKSYANMLGGKIWIQPNSGKNAGGDGSTFYFTIPYVPEQGQNTFFQAPISVAEEDIMSTAVAGEDNTLKTHNVLIAEDDLASEILFSIMIRIFSNKIFKVKTGIEAVDACRNNPEIDLILMDIKMPGIDGYEATRQIRIFNKKVVIIAQTAYAQTGDREKALAAGCNDYISKPIRKDDLMSLIKKHFAKQKNAGSVN
jgi:PAS domain S-box-containing protein